MKLINRLTILACSVLLLISTWSQADVAINVSASLIAPACSVRSENNNSPLKINFGTINPEELNTSTISKDFILYISDCNFSKNLAVILNPKSGSTLLYQGRNILATTIDGLGIDFTEISGGTNYSLEVSKKQRIFPQRVDDDLYRMDLKAQLVSAVPVKELKSGKFTSTVTFLVIYD